MGAGVGCLIVFRIIQALVAIVVLGCAAFYVAKTAWRTEAGNFMIFNACWTLLVLCYLGVATVWLSSKGHAIAIICLEVITLIFWFAGWIALAVDIPRRTCFYFINCSSTRALNSARAAIGFGALEWLLFCFSTVLVLYEVYKRRREHSAGARSGAETGTTVPKEAQEAKTAPALQPQQQPGQPGQPG